MKRCRSGDGLSEEEAMFFRQINDSCLAQYTYRDDGDPTGDQAAYERLLSFSLSLKNNQNKSKPDSL
jgi:hypothetical protein